MVLMGLASLVAARIHAPSAARALEPVDTRPLVVLDPGHGGTNTGAPGVAGVFEKSLTLEVARDVARRLTARGVRVALTRDADRYLTLRQRVAFANKANAALFVSIHLNASPSHSQRGYETFILTPRALDVDARALRVADGPVRYGLDRQTASLLDDVERGLSQPRAARLATTIQTALRRVRGAAGDRGVRQDSMHVLLGANMPAVLVELGFIDHPVEGRELLQPATRGTIAGALATAIASGVANLVGSADAAPRW